MYTQFFGNYLLSRNIISTQQLIDAMKEQSSTHIKLGTLAIHSGYMTASEVENIVILQTHKDKRFGELAIEEGYLTQAQVNQLIQSQSPNYLLLGQILIDHNLLSRQEFESLLIEYESENEIDDLDLSQEQMDQLDVLIKNFFPLEELSQKEQVVSYLTLFFHNLVRFIGDDFTPLNPIACPEIPTNYCVSQRIEGSFSLFSALDMEPETAVAFASQYVGDTFSDFDEYVKASVEDFLNLHNGLFNVNMSNSFSMELSLNPPELLDDPIIKPEGKTFLLPIVYSFGMINFIISI